MLSALAVCISLGASLDANLGAARAQTAAAEAQTSIPPEDRSWVSLGDGAASIRSARQVAAHYLSYAIMAGRAYDRFDARNADERNSALKEAYWPKTLPRIGERAFALRGQRWTLADWREGRQPCPAGDPYCRDPVGGLGVHFWKRQSQVRGRGWCSEVVIAFRGTEWTSGSWRSNFNPVAPVLILLRIMRPGADHYYQVRANIDDWVEKLQKTRCVGPRTKFIAVGHSLGGGLAQHAAYQNSRISKVYTFNTSPVTAWGQVSGERRDVNVKGLEIDHVVEQGEALAALRVFPGLWWGRRTCDPQERTIHFDGSHSDPLTQHRIWPLAQQLYAWSGADKVRRRGQRLAALPAATLEDKIAHNCITEPREEFLARVAADRVGRLPPSAITVRPTPANRR